MTTFKLQGFVKINRYCLKKPVYEILSLFLLKWIVCGFEKNAGVFS